MAARQMRLFASVQLMTYRGSIAGSAVLSLLLTSCATCFFGCERERSTSVRVGAGPSFVFAGSGRLATFAVYSPLPGQKVAGPHPDAGTVAWKIKASGSYFEGAHVEGLQLTYGRMPSGYAQLVPDQSQTAPPLRPGAIYSFFAETTGAAADGGYFYVDSSGIVQPVEVPELCLTSKSGRDFKVNCTTKEPYQEPKDIEKYVREHRKTQ